MASPLKFQLFDKSKHRRTPFACGQTSLDDYLAKRLNQHVRNGTAVGYVLADGSGRIAGYVTLSAGRLPIKVIPPSLGFPMQVPLPTTLIGRLAVDESFQGQGLGGDLLVHALRMSVRTARLVASAVIEVGAIDDAARGFYEHYDFASLIDDRNHLYLPMAHAKALVQQVFGPPSQ